MPGARAWFGRGLIGQTLTGFVLAAATEPADQVIEGAERINMSSNALERFVAALDGPPEEDADAPCWRPHYLEIDRRRFLVMVR